MRHVDPHSAAPATSHERAQLAEMIAARPPEDWPVREPDDDALQAQKSSVREGELIYSLSQAREAVLDGDLALAGQWLDAAELSAPEHGEMIAHNRALLAGNDPATPLVLDGIEEVGPSRATRDEPQLPAIELGELRRMAAEHELDVRLVVAGGPDREPWVLLHEPEAANTPILAAEAGAAYVELGAGGRIARSSEHAEHFLTEYRAELPRHAVEALVDRVEHGPARLAQLAADNPRRDPGHPARIATGHAVQAALNEQHPRHIETHLAIGEHNAGDFPLSEARMTELRAVAERFGGHYLRRGQDGGQGLNSTYAAAAITDRHLDPHSPTPATEQERAALAEYIDNEQEFLLQDTAEPGDETRLRMHDLNGRDADHQRALRTALDAYDRGDHDRGERWLDAAELAAPHRAAEVDELRTQPQLTPVATPPSHTEVSTQDHSGPSVAAQLAAQAQPRPATTQPPQTDAERPAHHQQQQLQLDFGL